MNTQFTEVMIKRLTIIILVLCLSGICFAESPLSAAKSKDSPQAAAPAEKSFEEKHKDKSALALLDDVAITVNKDWSYTEKRHKKMLILKEEAKDLGELPLYYDKSREKITEVQAFTVTPDGKKHRYAKIQDFNVYKGYPMYSDAMVKVVTFPQVIIGAILEYQMTLVCKGDPIKNSYWNYAIFDFGAPIKEFNLSITIPKKLGITYKEFGLKYKPKIIQNNSAITYSWHIENIEGKTDDESYPPPPNLENFSNFIEFSSIKSWGDISNWYYALVGKNLKINAAIEDAVKKATKDCKTTKDKVSSILEYIQNDFRYVSMSFGDNALEPHPSDEVFKNKYGDCKDLSLLCVAMLKAAGIKANVALFNSEYSITDPQYDLPMPSLFDHVIVLVSDSKEGDFYVDPLLKGYDIGEFPLDYQNSYTFIITENGGKFRRLPIFDEKRKYTKSESSIAIAEDSSAVVENKSIWDLDSSIDLRRRMNAMDEEEKKKFYQFVDNLVASGGEILERKIEGLQQKYAALKSYSKIKVKDRYQVTDGMIVINIGGFERGTDFTEKERKKPIFFPINQLREEITVFRLPKGFRLSYLPKNLNLDNGYFSFKREFIKKQDEIVVKETKRYRRCEIPKEEYKKIKDFSDQLPAKTEQRIMLKKIKSWKETANDIMERFRKSK